VSSPSGWRRLTVTVSSRTEPWRSTQTESPVSAGLFHAWRCADNSHPQQQQPRPRLLTDLGQMCKRSCRRPAHRAPGRRQRQPSSCSDRRRSVRRTARTADEFGANGANPLSGGRQSGGRSTTSTEHATPAALEPVDGEKARRGWLAWYTPTSWCASLMTMLETPSVLDASSPG